MTNDQMKPARFLRWQQARQKASRVLSHINNGGQVVVGTYTRATIYDRRHAEMFRATKTGLYVQRGKAWECIDGAAIRFC